MTLKRTTAAGGDLTQWRPPGPDRPEPARPSPVPWNALDGCHVAHGRVLRAAAVVTDDVARRPSLLPGWSVGHLLTHIARNADSHVGMVEGAARGEIAPQYPGGAAQRESGIEDGAGRPAAELAADVFTTIERLEQAWAELDAATWAVGVGRPFAAPASLSHLAFLRWREVELHLVDLGVADLVGTGPDRPDDVTDAYLDAEWLETLRRVPERLPAGVSVLLVPGDRPSRVLGTGDVPVVVRADPRAILAWLTGRAAGQAGWPELAPWP
jgi:maleylpyruvate isomerase